VVTHFLTVFTAETFTGTLTEVDSSTSTAADKYWPASPAESREAYWLAKMNARPCRKGVSAA